ncbi:enoyl-CoA hydratase/isomerase family protein [Microbulbifer agarilyticus]
MTTVHYEAHEGIGRFTFENGRLNLLTMKMHEELHRAYLQFLNDDSVKVGVLTGTGENFCAGDDLKESDTPIKGRDKPRWDEMTLMHPRSKPMIGAVKGYCFGQGLAYLLNLTDIRIAADNLVMGAPEIAYGMGGMSGGTHMATQLPYIHAAWISLTGEKFGAEKAQALNLVNEVVSPEALEARALEVAATIAAHPLIAIRTELDCLQRSAETTRADSLRHTMAQYKVQRQLHLASGATAISDLKKNK